MNFSNQILKLSMVGILSALSLQAMADGDDLIQAGEYVVAIDSLKDVQVLSTENGQGYVVRDMAGNIYSNISRTDLAVRRGCIQNMCVGQNSIAVDSVKPVNLYALDVSGNFVVVDDAGNRYANIGTSDLAYTAGCMGDLCVGAPLIAVDSLKDMNLVGLQTNGTYIVRDLSGNTYANINRDDLAVEIGCYGNICAGANAVALDSNKVVRIIALQTNGNFVVRDQSGNTYANIGSSDLAIIGQ